MKLLRCLGLGMKHWFSYYSLVLLFSASFLYSGAINAFKLSLAPEYKDIKSNLHFQLLMVLKYAGAETRTVDILWGMKRCSHTTKDSILNART